jgi:hypothetical protein
MWLENFQEEGNEKLMMNEEFFKTSGNIIFFSLCEQKGSTICLLCREIVMANKRFNLNRHHNTLNPNFESKFSYKFKLREE